MTAQQSENSLSNCKPPSVGSRTFTEVVQVVYRKHLGRENHYTLVIQRSSSIL